MYPTHSQPRACASSGLPRTAPSSSPHLSRLDYNLPRKEDFFLLIPTCPFGSRWYRSTLPSQTGQSDTQPSWAAWRFFVQWTEHSSCRFCEVGPVSPDECPGFRKSELGFSALVETWADRSLSDDCTFYLIYKVCAEPPRVSNEEIFFLPSRFPRWVQEFLTQSLSSLHWLPVMC